MSTSNFPKQAAADEAPESTSAENKVPASDAAASAPPFDGATLAPDQLAPEDRTAVAPAAPPVATNSKPPVAGGPVQAPASPLQSGRIPVRPMASTMEGPVARSSTGRPSASTPSPSGLARTLVPGEIPDSYLNTVVADRYRVLRKIGEGGMGTVYLAEHVIIEKRVALKILSEDFARKPDLVQRFLQEAKAASRIGHENIVDIIDFGETASGSVFIAMEFLDGKDLASVIREAGALPFDRCRYVVTQICRALGAAHAKGIIHRDMKPENVFLIEREGRPDFVKILDFGIAKISSLDNEGGARLTRTGMIFGTPEYMSPEQARGDRPDHRVDIYAVGCILYEALTGDVPFHADTFMGVLTKHMFEAPEPPSQRAPEKNIAGDVESVVLKALAKDRDSRFQTMKEFSTALAACGGMDAGEGWGNEPSGVVELAPAQRRSTPAMSSARAVASPIAEAAPPPARSRTPLFIAGGVVGVLAIVGGAFAVLRTPAQPDRPTVSPRVEQPVTPPVVPSTPVVSANVSLQINTDPAGAEIYLGKALLGATPGSISLPRGNRTVTLTLRKRDFKDKDFDVMPDGDRSYVVELTAKKGTTPGKPPSRPETNPPVSPTPGKQTPTPGKQTPTPGKTPGKLRDLKDPFADHK